MHVWRSRAAAILFATAVLGLGAGCGGSGPGPRRVDTAAEASPEARREFARVEREYQLARDQVVLEQGTAILTARPDHPLGDAITELMVRAAVREQRWDAVRELALGFPARWPASSRRDAVMLEAADALAAGGRTIDALRVAAVLADAQPAGATRDWTLNRAATWLQGLPDDQLASWSAATGPLASTAALVSVRRFLERGDLDAAAAVVADLDAARLADASVARARRELADARVRQTQTVSGRLGVLCPLTGRYARFGNAFLQGARLAVGHVPPPAGQSWDLKFEDTEADPVMAALQARKLCEEDGCSLLLGCLLSSTTATAALVAAEHDVSLISPTATSERLAWLGPHVLQTNQTGALEAALLARLACEVLLKQRYVIIRPDTPEGASMAKAFGEAVAELGGEVVGEQVVDPAATDFRREIRLLRESRPEVVFVPTAADQMVLLGPQLDFYRLGALVLGPSAWNSTRLLERAGTVMERAVFAAAEVAYPVEWSVDFAAAWPAADYDEEATAVGRGAYLAARLALETVAGDPGLPPAEVARRMRDALTGREAATAGPEGYASSVRMVEDGVVVPFPGGLYTVAWQRDLAARAALADSLAILPDSLNVGAPDSLGFTGEGR
ncbi:MAG: ABC transporter substrate-binding protein [Candidatus Krumholzibacteriia bacterium]